MSLPAKLPKCILITVAPFPLSVRKTNISNSKSGLHIISNAECHVLTSTVSPAVATIRLMKTSSLNQLGPLRRAKSGWKITTSPAWGCLHWSNWMSSVPGTRRLLAGGPSVLQNSWQGPLLYGDPCLGKSMGLEFHASIQRGS